MCVGRESAARAPHTCDVWRAGGCTSIASARRTQGRLCFLCPPEGFAGMCVGREPAARFTRVARMREWDLGGQCYSQGRGLDDSPPCTIQNARGPRAVYAHRLAPCLRLRALLSMCVGREPAVCRTRVARMRDRLREFGSGLCTSRAAANFEHRVPCGQTKGVVCPAI